MDERGKRELCVAVGDRVWQCRQQAKMSREALAERLGITPQYLNEIEQGKKCMSMAYFIQLGQIFHVSLDMLAYGPREEDPALERMIQRMKDMTPLDRELAAHMLLKAAEAVEAMGPEQS